VLEFARHGKGFQALLSPDAKLAGFRQLSFKVWSREQTLLAVVLEDLDKAKFHALVPLKANAWNDIFLTTDQFELNDDSPVKKNKLEAARLGPTLGIVDMGIKVGNAQDNLLKLTDLQTAFAGINERKESRIPELIDGTVFNITEDCDITHPITIKNGGKLVVKAKDVHLAANISMDKGSLLVDGGNFSIDNKFQHQFKFDLKNNSKLEFSSCKFSSSFPSSLDTRDSTVEIKNSVFSNGFTCSSANSTIKLDNATRPGEFIVDEGSHYKITNSHGVLLWTALGERQKGEISFPSMDKRISTYKLPASLNLDVSINDSDWIMWALLVKPGSDAKIVDSELMAAGVLYAAPELAKISDLKNNNEPGDYALKLTDRKLSFARSKVRAWNFYVLKNGNLEISNCTYGEINCFENAHVKVSDSTCDGSGGYIRISNNSSGVFQNCKFNCSIITVDAGKIVLKHCALNGNASAADNSRIDLIDSVVKGNKQQIGNGSIKTLRQ
jgi:hypothetical protein